MIFPGGKKAFLTEVLCSGKADIRFREFVRRGVLQEIFPEIQAMIGVGQPPEFHPEGDVFEHTMLMLKHMVYPDPLLAWSVLLHDVGKPLTRSVEESGRIRFFGHEEKGAEMAEGILENLGFPQDDTAVIVHAIRNHMRFAYVREMRKSKLASLMQQPFFGLELELHRLDCISCHRKMACFNFLLEAYCSRKEPEPQSLISGRELIALGVKPGKEMGNILRKLKQLQLSGVIISAEQALEYVRKLIK